MLKATNPTEQAAQQKTADDLRRTDLRALLAQESFQRFLVPVFRSSRTRVFSSEPTLHAYNQGRMDVLLDLLDTLRDADLALYQKAERESLQESNRG